MESHNGDAVTVARMQSLLAKGLDRMSWASVERVKEAAKTLQLRRSRSGVAFPGGAWERGRKG